MFYDDLSAIFIPSVICYASSRGRDEPIPIAGENARVRDIAVSKEQIADFCRRWKIVKFALFESILRKDFRPDSDIDVLVTFAPDAGWSLLDHVEMQDELKTLFGRNVDLVSRRGIERSRNTIRRKEILDSAEVVYAAA